MERPPDNKTAERFGALAREWEARENAAEEFRWSEDYRFNIAGIVGLVIIVVALLLASA